MRVPRTVMAVGGVVVAAAAIGFMDPKAVHAVTAALVQVTNTAANPVVSSDVTLAPAQIVQLYCSVAQVACYKVQPGGLISTSPYGVPGGQTLVITDIDIYTSKDSDIGTFGISQVGDCTSCTEAIPAIWYVVSDDGLAHHFSLTRGIAWPAYNGVAPYGKSDITAHLYGYLTNQ